MRTPPASMTSTTHPSLSLGEGSNGLDALFSTIVAFSDDDPIMRGLRDGTLSWADAAELEAAETLIAIGSNFPSAAPTTSVWATATSVWAEAPYHAAPATPPPRVSACPGAPKKPVNGKVVNTLIVRNLPRSADDLEALLRSTFEPYGVVRDVYIPKNMDASSPYFGTIKGFALIKYSTTAAAASAYDGEYGQLTLGKNHIAVEFAKEDR